MGTGPGKTVDVYNTSAELDPSEPIGQLALYHQDQAARHRRTLEGLIAHHEAAATQLMELQPKGAA